MNYTEVKLYIAEELTEVIASVLEDSGITGVVIENPEVYREFVNKKNDYDWDYLDESVESLKDVSSGITFYLEDTPEGIELLDKILSDIIIYDIQRVEVRSASDDEWKDKWKEYFKPAKITDRITIKPTWEEYDSSDKDEIVIEIDPGMAFGTGTHATTVLCLRLIEKYLSGKTDAKVLDIGCGSGVLSIAAVLSGASEAVGVDLDPVAVETAKKNVSMNNLDSAISIIEGDLTNGLSYKADIIAANLMADLIISLSKDIKKNLMHGGIFISSGILKEKEKQVASAIQTSGFRILEVIGQDDWCAIAASV